jgi:cytochrome P450
MMARVILGDAAAAAPFAAELAHALDQTAPEVIEAAESGDLFAPLLVMLASADAIHAMVRGAVAAGRLDPRRWRHTIAARCLGEQEEMDEAATYLLTTLMVVSVLTLGPVIFWTLHHLAEDPVLWDAAAAEAGAVLDPPMDLEGAGRQLPTIRGAVLEAIRLYPPYWIVSKTAQGPAQVAGVPIEAESRVHLIPWLTQRDARWFPRPEEFDPSRWDGVEPHALGAAFLPFLLGQRACPARGLALPEALGAVAAVVAGGPRFEPERGPAPVPVVHSLALRVPAAYPVRFAESGQLASSATMRSSLV